VKKIITDLAVFSIVDSKLRLDELMQGASLEDVKTKTGARFDIAPGVK
jgi:3-oxoacid CoA-transferase